MNLHAAPERSATTRAKFRTSRPPFDCIALLLQGGGALGAYQAGVYQALAERDLHPDWVAGISIGAINAALIAGNPPGTRIEKLRNFWESITTSPISVWEACNGRRLAASLGDITADAIATAFTAPLALLARQTEEATSVEVSRKKWKKTLAKAASAFESFETLAEPRGDLARKCANRWHATVAAVHGAPGLFSPRMLPPSMQPAGTLEATSYYDTNALKGTLERLVDFDRLNSSNGVRFSVGAVNVASGNFVYFDNRTHKIRPEHVMASGALPPGFPPIEIDGEYYWDGGLVSNTPLQWVMECGERQDTLAFQVDLWSARGILPRTLAEVETRQKEIRYSSRTRLNSDQFKKEQRLRNAFADLMAKLPDELRDTPEYRLLHPETQRKVYSIVQLIYRSKDYEGGSKDFEFSSRSMKDHWTAGYQDTVRTLRHPQVLKRPHSGEGVVTFDVAANGRM